MTDHNPYTPPASTVQTTDARHPGSPLKAILLGMLVDIGGTFVAGIAFGIAYGYLLAASGVPAVEISSRIAMASMPGTPLGIALTAMGTLLSMLGGHVCARIVRRHELRVAGVMAALSCGLALWMAGPAVPWLYQAGMAVLTVAAILAGAEVGRRRNRGEDAAARE